MNMMKSFKLGVVLCLSTVLMACSTGRGLGPVDKFLNETGAKKRYERWLSEKEQAPYLDIKTENELATLRSELEGARDLVASLRDKEYSIFHTIFGFTYERDLIPLNDFLDDETGKIFAYRPWAQQKFASGEITEAQYERYMRELEVMQDIVDELMEGKNPEI